MVAALAAMVRSGRSFSGREKNCVFLNTGNNATGHRRFANVSAASGLDFPDDARAIALADWDHDGDVDLFISNRNGPRLRFMRNDTPRHNRFVSIQLGGNGTTTNRDAIGARIEVQLDDPDAKPIIRSLRAGEGFLSQSSKTMTIGLGNAKGVKGIIVRWPTSGATSVEMFDGINLDGHYRFVQGSGKAERIDRERSDLALVPQTQIAIPRSDMASIRLPLRLPMLNFSYRDFADDVVPVYFNTNRPTLINIWATWCLPCGIELKEMVDRQDDIKAAGLDVIALAIDGMPGDPSTPEKAAAYMAKLKFPFDTGRANEQVLAIMRDMQNRQMSMQRQPPLPLSYLIDAKGRLIAIYKGPVELDTVLDDLANSSDSIRERVKQAAALPGRLLPSKDLEEIEERLDLIVRFQLATRLEGLHRYPEAAAHYRAILKRKADYAEAHNNLGHVLIQLGDKRQAAIHFLEAQKHKTDFAEPYHNLGNLALDRRDWKQAIQLYKKATQRNPSHVGFRMSLGKAILKWADPNDAVPVFESILKLDMKHVDAHYQLAVVHEVLGNMSSSKSELEIVLQFDPNHEAARSKLSKLSNR